MLVLLALMVVCVLRCVTKKATKKAREEKDQKVMTPHYAQPYWQSNQAQVGLSKNLAVLLSKVASCTFPEKCAVIQGQYHSFKGFIFGNYLHISMCSNLLK